MAHVADRTEVDKLPYLVLKEPLVDSNHEEPLKHSITLTHTHTHTHTLTAHQ